MKITADMRGGMLIAVVIAIMILGAIAAGLAALVSSGARTSADHSLSVQAFYLAETGFEWAAAELQKNYDPNLEWGDACQNLNTTPAQPVEDAGYFEITAEENEGCKITVFGWTGGPDLENATASRRLEGTIPSQIITGSDGGGDNIFDDSGNWKGGGANVDFENGSMILQRPGGQGQGQGGQGNTNTHADATDILTENFTNGELIFFMTYISWDPLSANDIFSIELQDIECQVYLPDLTSDDCNIRTDLLNYGYNLIVELGDGINADDINNITLNIDWGNGGAQEVILADGCIGTQEHCLGASEPQNPIENDWEE
jgi:type II secretory pathway pseudopilin PulG